jgi:hypothetical protein
MKSSDVRDHIEGDAESLCLKLDWQSSRNGILCLIDQALLEVHCVSGAPALDRIVQAGTDGFEKAETHHAKRARIGRARDARWRLAMWRKIVRHFLLLARWATQFGGDWHVERRAQA